MGAVVVAMATLISLGIVATTVVVSAVVGVMMSIVMEVVFNLLLLLLLLLPERHGSNRVSGRAVFAAV